MKIKVGRLLLFLLPLPFIYLSIAYKDFFYLIPGLIAIVLALVFNIESIFSGKMVALPDVKIPKLRAPDIKLPEIKAAKKLKSKKLYKVLSKYSLSGLIILLLILAVVFVLITVYKLPNGSQSTNLLVAYFQNQLIFIKKNIFLTGVVALLSLFFVTFQFKSKTGKKRLSLLIVSSITTLVVVFFALVLAYLGVFGYGIGEVAVLSSRIRTSPSSVGLVWGKDKIVEEIRNRGEAPDLVGVETSVDETIFELALVEDKKKSEFYRKRVAVNIPDNFLFSLGIPKESLILYKDHLLITELVKEDIETVSPIIGKLYLKRQLAPRYIKDEPTVQVMGRQEYLKYRDELISEAVEEIEGYIIKIQNEIDVAYGDIATARSEITSYESWLATASSSRDAAYNSCVNEICYTYSYSYYTGYYTVPYRCYSDAYCNSVRQSWDNAIAENQSGLQEWRNYLASQQRYLAELQELETLFKDYATLVESQKEQTPYELGIFEPERNIKVVLDYVNSKSVADYYVTLVHEYLHYTSYVSEERYLPQFFEEGLTEYFARKIVKEELDTSTNLGYPLIIKIIAEMSKKIPEDTWLDVYFNKDEKLLILTLNDVYGDNFYEESERHFTLMSYVSSKEALKIANDIMFKIGGSELTEEDLQSTYTGLD